MTIANLAKSSNAMPIAHDAALNWQIRRLLVKKRAELAENVKWELHAAVRRNEKSIALLTAKLLCVHAPKTLTTKRNTSAALITTIRCPHCKATVSIA